MMYEDENKIVFIVKIFEIVVQLSYEKLYYC